MPIYIRPRLNHLLNMQVRMYLICLKQFNMNSNLIKGVLALSYDELLNNPDQNWFVLYNNVYNISEYVLYGHPIYPSKYDHETQPKQMAYYLDQRLNLTMLSRCGSDAT